jgi:ATP-dependent DNA ligase
MYDFCIPTTGTMVPSGLEWFHEIKFDGYRLRVERKGDRVRLITKGGYDWTKRFPSAPRKLPSAKCALQAYTRPSDLLRGLSLLPFN